MEIVYIEAVLMDNDELIHMGKTLGFIGKRQRELVDSKGAGKMSKGGITVVEIKRGKEDNCA